MMKLYSFDVVLQEVPDEISLALSISGCPMRCKGCHSSHLYNNTGEELTPAKLSELMNKYQTYISCILFMGGEWNKKELIQLLDYIKLNYPNIKTALYSGLNKIDDDILSQLDYIKLGAYKEELGNLTSPTTNQRMYKRTPPTKELEDITYKFKSIWG